MKRLEFEKVWNDLLAVLEPGMIVYTLVRTYGNKIERIDCWDFGDAPDFVNRSN